MEYIMGYLINHGFMWITFWMWMTPRVSARQDGPGCPGLNRSMASFEVIVQRDYGMQGIWTAEINDSVVRLEVNDPAGLMNAYSRLSRKQDVTQINTDCPSVGLAHSYTQRWTPTYKVNVSRGISFSDVGTCMEGYSPVYIGKAIVDVYRQENLNNLIFIYTKENSKLVDSVKKNTDGTDKISEWLVSDTTLHNLNHLWTDLDYEIRGVILATGPLAVDILNQARQQNVSTYDLVWVVVTAGMLDVWRRVIVPGEKIVLLNTHPSAYLPAGPCPPTAPLELFRPEYEILLVSMATDLLEVVGTWNPVQYLVVRNEDLWTFEKFLGKHFTIVTRHLAIFHEKEVLDNGTVVWSGLCIEILKALADALNFTYTLVEPADNQFGAPYPNGTWNGMVGMVYRKEADWAVAKFTVTEIRDSVIDYTSAFWYEPAVMVMRKPQENKMLVYLRPFKRDVWIALFFSVPFMGLVVAMTAGLEQRITAPHPADHPYVHPFWYCLDRSTWCAFGAMLQQGPKWCTRSQTLRFLTGMWWFFVIAVAATYTGNLIAVLAVPKTVLPVQTLTDLAAQSVYAYGSMGGAALITMFNSSTSEVYGRLWRQEIQFEKNHVSSHQQGLDRVKSGESYIYLGERGGVAPVVFNDCDYALGKEEFFPSSFGFVFPENSPYIPIINKKIVTMIETGLIDSWTTEFYPKDKCSLMSMERVTRTATLQDVQGAFSLLLAGTVTALVCLGLEWARVWYTFRQKKSIDRSDQQNGRLSWPRFSFPFVKRKHLNIPVHSQSNGTVSTKDSQSNGTVRKGSVRDNGYSTPSNFMSALEIEDMARVRNVFPGIVTRGQGDHVRGSIQSRAHERRRAIRRSIKPQDSAHRTSMRVQMSVRKRDSIPTNNNTITNF